MNWRRLSLIAAALVLAILGIAATFFPDELLQRIGAGGNGVLPLLVQLMGALYLAFAIQNWTAKDSLIGGIYNRPLALANLVHFVSGALALAKGVSAHHDARLLWPLTIVYWIFAAVFARIAFTSPVVTQE